jgi:hypothetical protein
MTQLPLFPAGTVGVPYVLPELVRPRRAQFGSDRRQRSRLDPDWVEIAWLVRRTPAELAELAELQAELSRQEWAADGGEGSVCSLDLEPWERVPCLNVEWMLHGTVIEALAAIELRRDQAQPEALEQSEFPSQVAE